MLKDVKPEDIEDVTERYVHLFTEERNSDIVKKVNLKDNSFYLISLIEHKPDVDYNVFQEMNGGIDEDVKKNMHNNACIPSAFHLYLRLQGKSTDRGRGADQGES